MFKALAVLCVICALVAVVVGVYAGMTLAITSVFTAMGFWPAVLAFGVLRLAGSFVLYLVQS